jgi:hypothetical protein
MRKAFILPIVFLSLISFNCRKERGLDEKLRINNEKEFGTTTVPGGGLCPTAPVMAYIQERMKPEDFGKLEMDSIKSILIDSGKLVVYKIPFQSMDPEFNFIMVAENETKTEFQGRIYKISPANDYGVSGEFKGSIEVRSLDRDTVDQVILDSGRIQNDPSQLQLVMTNGSSLMPEPEYVPLPEVVIVSWPRPRGIDYGVWLNILNWLGVQGGSGIGSGLAPGYGGPNGGVYSPSGVGYGGSGSFETPPVCEPPPSPTITYDDALTNPPKIVAEPASIDNGIQLKDIPASAPTPTNPPRILAFSPPRGNIEDLQYGTNANKSGILLTEVNRSNAGLLSEMSDMIDVFTIASPTANSIGHKMILKFINNTSNQSFFENNDLNSLVLKNHKTENFLKDFGELLKIQLKNHAGDINSVPTMDLGSLRPIYNDLPNTTHGLRILINDTEETTIQLDDYYHIPANKTWEARVTVTIIDHFGLDRADAKKFQLVHRGFADWWLLQHDRGFVPFKTKITIKLIIAGDLL